MCAREQCLPTLAESAFLHTDCFPGGRALGAVPSPIVADTTRSHKDLAYYKSIEFLKKYDHNKSDNKMNLK